MIPCARSAPHQSTIEQVRSIASRVPWNLTVSTTCSTRSAEPTLVRPSARSGKAGRWSDLASWVSPERFPNWPCSPISSFGRACTDGWGKFYGITMLYRKDPKPLREDLPDIFALLLEKKIDPLINHTFPLLEARQALELLVGGAVEGKIVLING